MISAIAARKAAKAAQQQQQEIATPSPPPQPPIQSPKRKHSSRRTKPASKKQKRGAKQDASPQPEPDAFRSQDAVIVIESDDSEEGEPASQLSPDDSDIEMLTTPPPRPGKRAWSPSMPLVDSSSEEEAPMDMSDLIDVPVRFSRLPQAKVGATLSTFTPVLGQNMYHLSDVDIRSTGLAEARGTIVILEQGETACILGTCRLTLLKGSVVVNGVSLLPSTVSYNIFAPRSSPLPIIEGRVGGKSAIDVSALPFPLHHHMQSRSAVVLLQELRTGVEGLGRICRIFEGVYERSGWAGDSVSSPFQIPGLYLVRKQTRDITPFTLPSTWSEALSNLPTPSQSSSQTNPTFLVKGQKKCGKSTFARTLLNTLLSRYSRVAYLECDLGQSEFTPGGLLALSVISKPVFGPPYTHPAIPFRAHFVGATTPKASPAAYLEGVRDLVEVWKVDVAYVLAGDEEGADGRITDTVPLVVNTMGWTKGLGADLMQKIEEMVEPSEVFEFKNDEPSFSYPTVHAFPDTYKINSNVGNTHVLEPVPVSTLSTNYTPADHRTISILSYFHAVFPPIPKEGSHSSNGLQSYEQLTAQLWDTDLPLCAIPPYEVDVRVAFDQVILTGAGSEDVVPEEIGRVLNGALVGFVRSDHQHVIPTDSAGMENANSTPLPYTQAHPPPPPSESSCIGLGLIRGISITSSPPSAVLHILTPIPPSLLTGARILVKGEMELPVWGMLDFRDADGGVAGVEKGKVPYLQWGRMPEGVIGGEKRRVRRNLMRRGQV